MEFCGAIFKILPAFISCSTSRMRSCPVMTFLHSCVPFCSNAESESTSAANHRHTTAEATKEQATLQARQALVSSSYQTELTANILRTPNNKCRSKQFALIYLLCTPDLTSHTLVDCLFASVSLDPVKTD